jgi:hypothetical protein
LPCRYRGQLPGEAGVRGGEDLGKGGGMELDGSRWLLPNEPFFDESAKGLVDASPRVTGLPDDRGADGGGRVDEELVDADLFPGEAHFLEQRDNVRGEDDRVRNP